jgi:FlaA1/EpsC-like NDP-sugar epimerase
MMEANASEAFLNNVIGTRHLLDTGPEFGCERFVMISTDKAVNPSSVMGATKRLGEMLVQSRAEWPGNARLASVRFGNVAGSRGSVIPIFLKQIAEGKAITLTDERMSRYFMTAAEAVQLALEASTLASGGEIYMLDMGDPVMITTLACRLIEMAGLQPKDFPIKIIGIRPGEKLQEELWSNDAYVSETEFPRVRRVDEGEIPEDLEDDILELEELAGARRDEELREKLRSMPIGYCQQDKFAASAGD